jgi:predicted DCC family thiol-disulfide oxidoreductase YuxK
MEAVMNEQYPLTVYFDGSCGLCSSEMQAIQAHDSERRLILVDCSAADFDDSAFRAEGISRVDMMARLHVRNGLGAWIKGVAAFELLYRTVGMSAFASLWGGKFTRPAMERIYPWVARHRQLLSWTGMPVLFKLLGKCQARRTFKRSRRCSEGRCSI